MSQYAPADLDNIRLADFEGRTLYAEYELEHLVVTGSPCHLCLPMFG